MKHFGTQTIDIIENAPERLTEIEGIGQKRIHQIADNWKEHRAIHNIMLYLTQHGIGSARAGRIFRYYGYDAIQVIEKTHTNCIMTFTASALKVQMI